MDECKRRATIVPVIFLGSEEVFRGARRVDDLHWFRGGDRRDSVGRSDRGSVAAFPRAPAVDGATVTPTWAIRTQTGTALVRVASVVAVAVEVPLLAGLSP